MPVRERRGTTPAWAARCAAARLEAVTGQPVRSLLSLTGQPFQKAPGDGSMPFPILRGLLSAIHHRGKVGRSPIGLGLTRAARRAANAA